MVHQATLWAVVRWRETVEAEAAVCRAGRSMMNVDLSKGFRSWLLWRAEAVANASSLERGLSRMAQLGVSRGWASWVEASSAREAACKTPRTGRAAR